MFDSVERMVAQAFDAVQPSDIMTVTEAGQRYNVIRQQGGGHNGLWSLELTPYLQEFQDTFTALEYQGCILVAPARTGKSMTFMNWLAHTAKCDPADMMTTNSAQHRTRDWSKSDLAKFLRDSTEIHDLLLPGRVNDNIYDKEFLSGMRLTNVWPTIDHFSGKTIPRHFIFDYDRIDDSVDNEGPAFDLVMKRGETFKRFAMTVAESSPGRLIENPKWIPQTPHEAPPLKGILGLYNRGDRRRWNWKCEQCREAFEPSFSLFDHLGLHHKGVEMMEAAQSVRLLCPRCGYPHTPDMKTHLNSNGRWVKEGLIWTKSGEFINHPAFKLVRSNIASFWLKGPAAAYQSWESLVLTYLQAEYAYEQTGDEEPLKKTTTNDQGEPYTPKALISDRSPEMLKEKVEEWGAHKLHRSVHPDVRFLICTIDVQARASAAFVFQVHGFTADGDIIIIDTDRITKSNRLDEDGEHLRIDPAAFPEDWDVLIDLIERTYPLADDSGRRMAIKMLACDSGGAEGVTLNAYKFWRRLRDDPERRGYHRKFALVKGGNIENNPTTRILVPDSNQKNRNSGAIGDVPVVEMNPWKLKDQISNMLLRRIRAGLEGETGRSIRFPKWIPDWFFTQVTSEVRTAKGWENPQKRRNEAWDLLYYALGIAIRPHDVVTEMPLNDIKFDKIKWNDPASVPPWADVWDNNSLVIGDKEEKQIAKRRAKKSFAELGEELNK